MTYDPKAFQLDGEVAVVTGAGAGIGKAIAATFAGAGATVAPVTGRPGCPGLRRGSDGATEEVVARAILDAARVQDRRDDPGRFSAARRAEAMLRRGLAEDVGVGDVARALGIPLRTIEQGFRDLYGTSARDYLYALRMNAARRDLLRAEAGDTVGAVACRWGLFHLGRFSTHYRLLFGETPRETLRSGRAQPAGYGWNE